MIPLTTCFIPFSYLHSHNLHLNRKHLNKQVRHIDYITTSKEENDKCKLLNYEIPKINFVGGGTYTYGALKEARVCRPKKA